MAQKNERQKKAGLLNREGSVRYRPSCLSRQGGTEKISRVTTATSSTMVLDSSGTCTVSAGWLLEMCARRLWLECVTATR